MYNALSVQRKIWYWLRNYITNLADILNVMALYYGNINWNSIIDFDIKKNLLWLFA